MGLENFLMEFYQMYKKSNPQHRSQYFVYLKKPNIFGARIYQLKNFDMNFKGCYLGCLLLKIYALTFKLQYIKIFISQNIEHFEHVEPTIIYITKIFHLRFHYRELALHQRILLIITNVLLLKALEAYWSFTVINSINF